MKLVCCAVVIAAAIFGWRTYRAPDAIDPAIGPTPTIREGNAARSAKRLHRGRLRVMQLQPGTLRLEGQVVDDREMPVPRARVVLGNVRETVTEDDGSFAFDHLAAGKYQLTAEKQDAYSEDDDTRLTATSDPVTLKLRRGAQLIVHVVDAVTRAPIANAKVATSDRTGITDDTGTVTLRAIDSGYEKLEVSAEGHAFVTSWVTSDAPAMILERTVPLGRAAPISGIVVDDDGKPVSGAMVDLDAAGGVWSERVEADADGRWSISTFGAGRHAVHASSDLHVAMPDLTFESDGIHPTTGIVVRVRRGARVSGIVVDPAGRPVADIRVHGGSATTTGSDGRFLLVGLAAGKHEISASSDTGATPDVPVEVTLGGTAEIRLVFQDSGIAGIVTDARGQPVANATVVIVHKATETRRLASADEYGKFDFGGVAPGEYAISARREDVMDFSDRVGRAVKSGDRDVRVVVPELAMLRGRVMLDGKPVQEYGIVVAFRRLSPWGTPTVVRAADGRFTRTDVMGSIAVTVIGEGFTNRSIEHVQVSPGITTDLGDIVVERGRVIAGRVVDARGLPVASALVTVVQGGVSSYDADDATLKRRMHESFARTDAAGRYTIAGIDPANRELRIEASHDRGFAMPRLLGDATTLDLVLGETGRLDGTIANFTGDQLGAVAIAVSDPALRFPADLDRAGNFHLARLPAGDYDVRLTRHNTLPPQRVTIVAGARSVVAFALPAEPITLTVRADGCRMLVLRDPGGDHELDYEPCNAGAGEIKHVSPGRYQVCLDLSGECSTIEVAAGPQRQTIVLPRR